MSSPRFVLAPGVAPVVQIGIGDTRSPTAPGAWGTARWSTAGSSWAGTEPYWLDVSCYVVAVESHTGRARTVSRFDAGTCTITLANPDGWADVLTAPDDPATLQLRPGRQIRWGIRVGTKAPVWKWRGYIDAHAAAYDGLVADSDTVTLGCVDALGEVGRATLVRLAAPVGDLESPTARVKRILDAVGWPAAWRRLEAATVPMLPTDLDGQAVDLLGQTADTAGGSCYGGTDGFLWFRARDWQTYEPSRPVDAIVGNVAGADACPLGLAVEFLRDGTVTRAIVDYSGNTGVPTVVEDAANQAIYGIETGPTMLDMMTASASQLTLLATRLINTQGVKTAPRVAGVELDAAHPGSADVMVAADPFKPSLWRVGLTRAGRTVFNKPMLVTGVDHRFDDATWRCRVSLDDAAPWKSTGARWDSGIWNRALWS